MALSLVARCACTAALLAAATGSLLLALSAAEPLASGPRLRSASAEEAPPPFGAASVGQPAAALEQPPEALPRALRDTGFPARAESGYEELKPPKVVKEPDLFPKGPKRYMVIDVSYMRWLWWPLILYLFWGMAFVCDAYFVRAIEIISERFHIPDDVAGATLMALGCNGPELALNTIAICHPSNIGVGAVIGGEVFNVLVIIGTALLATPQSYMPLKLRNFSFFRDVAFYILSVGLLYWTLQDGNVSRQNASVLMIGGCCYTAVVVYSSQISRIFSRSASTNARVVVRWASEELAGNRLRLMPARMVQWASEGWHNSHDSGAAGRDPELVKVWGKARSCTDPAEGSVLEVRAGVRSRLMDRGQRAESRYAWLREDALVVSTVLDPSPKVQLLQREQSGAVYDHDRHTRDNHWHHSGLVNQPVFLAEQDSPKAAGAAGDDAPVTALGAAFSATPMRQLSRPLLNEVPKLKSSGSMSLTWPPPPIQVPGFRDAPWEIIPLEDILYCEYLEGKNGFQLYVHQHDSSLGNLITLELSARKDLVMESWVSAIRQKLQEQRRRTADGPKRKTALELVMEWVEWLQFPVKFCVARTVPDMADPRRQHLYPVTFVMSMAWLAGFAYSVVKVCDGIHEDFGISVTVLGFTVAAAGTSFPNVFSGMCVARQGKTSMAVANALGANVQNVFLALAVPWAIQSFFIVGGPFPMVVDDLVPAVLECLITLLPVVLVYVCCGCSMPRWSGGMFLLVYLVYLVFALGQQASGCVLWPFRCRGG